MRSTGRKQPSLLRLSPSGSSDTYKAGWSQTLDTLWGTQSKGEAGPADKGDPQTRQLFEDYLNYAILASATDDTAASVISSSTLQSSTQ